MSCIWEDYNDAIRAYSNNDYARELLEIVFTDLSGIEINFSLIDTLIPGNTTLIHLLERLTTALTATDENRIDAEIIDIKKIMSLICISLYVPDTESIDESSILRTLNIFFSFMCVHQEDILVSNEHCRFTYRFGVKKLQERQTKKYEFPSIFFYKYNEFIEIQRLDFQLASDTAGFLIEYAASYRNMIQNLSIFNNTCNAGFLAFVCISKLFLRKNEEKKKLYVSLFNMICMKLSSFAGMTEMQTGIMNSNFQLLVRQVGKQLPSEADDIVMALLRVGPHYSHVKPLALLINQLPFPFYATLVKVLLQWTRKNYKKERQQFAYSLLESPYIICDDDQDEHEMLIKYLIATVLNPISTNDHDNIKCTVMFVDKMLKLHDETTQNALREIITTSNWCTVANILNFTFERTSPLWNKNKAEMNECFISIYCSLFLMNYEIPLNNYLQLEQLINSSDSATLLSSIPVLIKLLNKSVYVDDDISYLIGTTLVTNALSPNMLYSRYLQALYNFLFEDGNNGKAGVEICNILYTYGVKIENLISKMYIQQYFKLSTLYKLFSHINEKNGLELIEKAVYVIDMPLVLPGLYLQKYCIKFISSPTACVNENLNTLCSILHKITYDRKGNDLKFLHQFLEFLENNLLIRTFPTNLLKSVVITTKKLKEKFNSNYTRLLNLFHDIERKIIDVSNEYDEDIHQGFITRDLHYYSEFAVVFGTKIGFVVCDQIADIYKRCLNYDLFSDEDKADALLKTACALTTRREDLILPCSKLLNKLILAECENLQIVALNGLYDLAVLKSQHFDSLIVPICQFMRSTNSKVQIVGLKVFMKLVDKEYIIPNHWQLYCLTYTIARDYDLIEVQIGKLVIFNFIHTLAKCYEQYFINIVLYFNNYYDHQIYPLKVKDMSKIPTKQVPLDRREAVYKLILRSFSSYTYHKILNHIYNSLFKNMFLPSMTYAKSYELVQDVMTITLIVLKQSHFTYEKGNMILYNHTIERIKELDDSKLNRSKIPETDNDNTIKNVVSCLTDLMKVADGRIKFIIPELMHVLLAVCEWYFDNICNIILNEKSKHFYSSLKGLPALFKSFKHLIHSPVFDTPAQNSAQTSEFYRI